MQTHWPDTLYNTVTLSPLTLPHTQSLQVSTSFRTDVRPTDQEPPGCGPRKKTSHRSIFATTQHGIVLRTASLRAASLTLPQLPRSARTLASKLRQVAASHHVQLSLDITRAETLHADKHDNSSVGPFQH